MSARRGGARRWPGVKTSISRKGSLISVRACVVSSVQKEHTADIFISNHAPGNQQLRPLTIMIITATQRFVYSLLALTFVTIAILVLLNVYALEIFLALIIVEFLVLVELTKPSAITMAWRKNIAIFVIICAIAFAIILYERTVAILR